MIAALAAVLLLVAPPTLVEPPPLAEASAPAVRLDPPVSVEVLPDVAPPSGSSASASGRCVGWEPLLAEHSPGWSVERMSRIMYRESRCQPGAMNRTSTAAGLLQVLGSHCKWITGQLGTWCTRARLADPDFNVRAAAALWAEQGYGAWSL